MKRVALHLAAIAASLVFFSSCEKETMLSVDQQLLTFTEAGGSQILSLTANKPWTASSDQSWCKVTPTAGEEATSSRISVNCEPNTTYDTRYCKITFTCAELVKTVSVTQDESDGMLISPREVDLSYEAQTVDVVIKHNVEFDVVIPADCSGWISIVATKGLETNTMTFSIAKNDTYDNREGSIKFKQKNGSLIGTVKIVQAQIDRIQAEREALIALYNSTEGDKWHDTFGNGVDVRANWCSSKPVSSWNGIYCNPEGYVVQISLPGASLHGCLPEELGNLTELRRLNLDSNEITGNIPETFAQLKKMEVLSLCGNRLQGSIPSFLGSFTNLKELWLHDNYFTGSIPETFVNLKNLTDLRLVMNLLSGTIPDSFYDWDFWKFWWGFSLSDNLYEFENIVIPGPDFSIQTIDGHQLNSHEVYATHKYTILFQWYSKAPLSGFIQELQEIDSKYGEEIFILSWANSNHETKDEAVAFFNDNRIPGEFFYWDYSDYNFTKDTSHLKNTFGTIPQYPAHTYYGSSLTVVDNNGRVVLSDVFNLDARPSSQKGELSKWLEGTSVILPDDRYQSSDYSQDGEITALQQSIANNGPNLVIIGDGYSDRQQDLFDFYAEKAYSAFFGEEPYSSHKEFFNVYKIRTVSKNEGYEDGNETALSCSFGEGTSFVGGNNRKCLLYAINAGIDPESLDQTTFLVLVNRDCFAGTCFLYEGSYDYLPGDGLSIAYCATTSDATEFTGVVSHEASGHGFAKLADEYALINNGTISADDIAEYMFWQSYGWWKNVDLTSDPTQVKWSHFLSDSRYADEGLSCYEGGLTFWSGVWRPTENSIMRGTTGGFNAPSREAIWTRIHNLVYGDSWKYDYEEFVAWDLAHRAQTKSMPGRNYVEQPLSPLHPPVIVGHTWREEFENAH